MITAALVRTHVLDPTMEAVVHNQDQYCDTPEVDSLLERARERISRMPAGPLRTEVLALIEATIESNLRERDCVTATAGFADEFAAQLHRIETSGLSVAMNTKAIADALRGPLKIARVPAGRTAKEITDAHLAIKDVVSRMPRKQLLTENVKHDLGDKLTAVLETYVENHWGAEA